jgi:hypothetical protein
MQRFITANALVAAALGAGCASYSPNLGSKPFFCADTDPKCPDGYTCTSVNSKLVCVANQPTHATPRLTDDSPLEGASGNDSIETAVVAPAGAKDLRYYASISDADDRDTYAVSVGAAGTLDITIQSGAWGGSVSGVILDRNGAPIATQLWSDSGSRAMELVATDLTAGTYYVQLFGASPASPANNYALEIGTL